MPSNSHLLPLDQAIQAFDAIALSGEQEMGKLASSGVAALSMALSGWMGDPNRKVRDGQGKTRPLLLAILNTLCREREMFFHEVPQAGSTRNRAKVIPKVKVSLDPEVPFPPEISDLPARERLAFVLLRSGADPWTQDQDGLDAMDWAVRTQSRSLFQALLSHPDCPPIEDLKKRTSTSPGREVPWLHSLAYFSGVKMIEDLEALGWDLCQKDKSGWPPAAWSNTEHTLEALLNPLTNSQRTEQRPILEKAWARRRSMKLVAPVFDLGQKTQAIERLAALSAKDKKEVALFQMMEGWLSANPAHDTYKYKGASWKPSHDGKSPLSVAELVEQFDWRLKKRSGSAKGTWSMLSAAAWGVARGERTEKSSRNFLQVLGEVLTEVPSQTRKAWLEEEIRPGLSNQGLMCWAFGSFLKTLHKELLSGQDAEARKERVESAANAALAMSSRTLSSAARGQLKSKIQGLWGSENMSNVQEPWVWPLLSGLLKKGLFDPDLQTYIQQTRAIKGNLSRSSGEELPEVFSASISLLRLELKRGLTFNVDDRRRMLNKFREERASLWEAVRLTLQAEPSLGAELDAEQFPFEEEDGALAQWGLPTRDEWESLVQEARMEVSIEPGVLGPGVKRAARL